MADLFNNQHEADLSEYDSTATDGGDLSQGSPGLAGTSGRMEALIDDATAIHGRMELTINTNDFRFRIYIDINTLTMASGDEFTICQSYTTDPIQILTWNLQHDGSNYRTRFIARDDGNAGSVSGYHTFTDAPHYFEIHIHRSSSDVANDGYTSLWIDGVLAETESSIDNYDIFPNFDYIQVGMCTGRDAGTSGTFYLDEFKANDDGGEIGPISSTALPMAMHHYQMRRAAQCG